MMTADSRRGASLAAERRGTSCASGATRRAQHSSHTYSGEHTRNDRGAFLGSCGSSVETGPNRVSIEFIDSTFGAPYVQRLRTLGFRIA